MNKRPQKYNEAQLTDIFGLDRVNDQQKMVEEWFGNEKSPLNATEKVIFDDIFEAAHNEIANWGEEDLKMNFIAFVLKLGHLTSNKTLKTYFEKTIEAQIDDKYLKVKTDFMVASGVMSIPKHPYFHFQEYKRQIDPNGDPMAQLLQAMLIAQAMNKNDKPIYGCTVIGKYWEFVLFRGRTYCVSQSYDCTKRPDLMDIISILRKFKFILETRLL